MNILEPPWLHNLLHALEESITLQLDLLRQFVMRHQQYILQPVFPADSDRASIRHEIYIPRHSKLVLRDGEGQGQGIEVAIKVFEEHQVPPELLVQTCQVIQEALSTK